MTFVCISNWENLIPIEQTYRFVIEPNSIAIRLLMHSLRILRAYYEGYCLCIRFGSCFNSTYQSILTVFFFIQWQNFRSHHRVCELNRSNELISVSNEIFCVRWEIAPKKYFAHKNNRPATDGAVQLPAERVEDFRNLLMHKKYDEQNKCKKIRYLNFYGEQRMVLKTNSAHLLLIENKRMLFSQIKSMQTLYLE